MKDTTLSYLLLFILAFTVHLIGINQIGRTWDEQYKIDMGYIAWDRIGAGDFSLPSWEQGAEHPMVAKYIYGFLLTSHLTALQTPSGPIALPPHLYFEILNGNYLQTTLYDTLYAASYDITLPRIGSAIFNSLAVVLAVVIARFFISGKWAYLPAFLLLLTPRFVFLGQLVTFESISVFLFCLILITFNKLLASPSKTRNYLLVGLLCGLFFWTRYNNIIFLPFLLGVLAIHYYYFKEKNIFNPKLLLIPAIAFLFGIAIWPLQWHGFPSHLFETFGYQNNRLIGLSTYYWEYLLITTPIPILIASLIGIYFCFRKKTYWKSILLWWITCIFAIYSIFVIKLGGTRCVVIIYPALAILASYGFSKILKGKLSYLLIPILLFLMAEQIKIFPYYLDYYNHFIGGPKGAIERGYDFSWWGEGQREAGMWLKDNSPLNATIGLIVTPKYVFPRINGRRIESDATITSTSDFIVVSHSEKHRLTKDFYQRYVNVYQAKADGESLVDVWKKK